MLQCKASVIVQPTRRCFYGFGFVVVLLWEIDGNSRLVTFRPSGGGDAGSSNTGWYSVKQCC